MTNTSSNESHHHDHEPCAMSLLFIFNNFSPFEHSSHFQVSRIHAPKASGWAGLIWPAAQSVVSSRCRGFPQDRPMCVCVGCVRACLSFHLESPGPWVHSLSTQSSFRLSCCMTRRNFLCRLSIPSMQRNVLGALPLELPTSDLESRTRRTTAVNSEQHGGPFRGSLHRVSRIKLKIGQAPHHPLQLAKLGNRSWSCFT